MNNKLQAKDLINIGLFTVLYFVLGCCVAIPIGFVPIFLPVLGSLWTLITGIPFMLFAVRVKKFGMVTIMAVLSGLLMGFTGMGFWGVPVWLVFGLLGDLISTPDENEAAAKEILGRLDLTPFLERHPASLSGGQKQRLAIASAMAAERSVLFFDESTSGLDYRHMLQTAQLLKQLRRSGRTAYIITHDPELICECCTDIIHLEDGRIKACYTMDAYGLRWVRDFFRIGETMSC